MEGSLGEPVIDGSKQEDEGHLRRRIRCGVRAEGGCIRSVQNLRNTSSIPRCSVARAGYSAPVLAVCVSHPCGQDHGDLDENVGSAHLGEEEDPTL